MHPGASEFISRNSTTDAVTVLEVGSRNINGSARGHFPNARWTGIDLYAGPCVDIECDAMDYAPSLPVDLVIIAEVLEHCPYWGELLHHVANWLKPGGRILITCAGPGRDPHSASDGGALQVDEHYANISQSELAEELHYAGFERIEVSSNEHWKDTYAIAMKAPS